MKISEKVRFVPACGTFAPRSQRLVRFSIVGNGGFVVETWGVNAADAVSRYQDKIRAAQRQAAKSLPATEQPFTLSIPWSFQPSQIIRG